MKLRCYENLSFWVPLCLTECNPVVNELSCNCQQGIGQCLKFLYQNITDSLPWSLQVEGVLSTSFLWGNGMCQTCMDNEVSLCLIDMKLIKGIFEKLCISTSKTHYTGHHSVS